MASTTLGEAEVRDRNIQGPIARSKVAVISNALVGIPSSAWRVFDAMSEPLPGDGTLEAAVNHASFTWEPTVADTCFFVALRNWRIVGATANVEVAGTDAGAVTAIVKRAASGTDIAAGTAIHTGTINLKGTVDTNQSLTLSATSADLDIAPGQRLGFDLTGVPTAARGCVSVALAPAASADDLLHTTGVHGTAVPHISTGDVKALGTTTKRARAIVTLPPDYQDLGALKIRAWAGMTTTIAATSATLDFEVFRVDHEDGTPGAADLVGTNATDINSLAEDDKEFFIDPATLHPGDQLDVRMTITVVDPATGTAVIADVWKVELVTDLV